MSTKLSTAPRRAMQINAMQSNAMQCHDLICKRSQQAGGHDTTNLSIYRCCMDSSRAGRLLRLTVMDRNISSVLMRLNIDKSTFLFSHTCPFIHAATNNATRKINTVNAVNAIITRPFKLATRRGLASMRKMRYEKRIRPFRTCAWHLE